ncbi:VOC family protein [Pseudoduganella namucuonensis]|uniref:Catechol 2,3-dioxygenase n=1 Tax=Pseudoduganella namucuonensis TaxID=1035707 RepID=A0A1I7LS18_9BURK|nr:VOC family protein [Pseudoduganella namucuonensis]SFV12485.1 Catechol 2,3-dioxygenase [Pseudoduganella namucuonensis]
MEITLSHRGVCVSDIARSAIFYEGALDFAPAADAATPAGTLFDPGAGHPGSASQARLLRNPQRVALELLRFQRPAASGPRVRRPNNQFGLTHLAFYVESISAVAERVRRCGGQVFEHTRARYPEGGAEMMYCTDPDGTRIELMQMAGAIPRFSHSGVCVREVARAQRFYDALGFAEAENYDLQHHSAWLDVINELDHVKLRAQMVRAAAGDTLELLHFTSPAAFGPTTVQPFNRYGLTHLAFLTDDLEAAASRVVANGGTILHTDPVCRNDARRLFCSDPDGVRLVLLRRAAPAHFERQQS